MYNDFDKPKQKQCSLLNTEEFEEQRRKELEKQLTQDLAKNLEDAADITAKVLTSVTKKDMKDSDPPYYVVDITIETSQKVGDDKDGEDDE